MDNNLNQVTIREFFASRQATFFYTLKQSEFTGQVYLKESEQKQWTFYVYLGRIFYATGGFHSVRRYKRNLALYMPEMISELAIIERDSAKPENFQSKVCWEYDLLNLWIDQEKINSKQITKLIFAQIAEILFELTQAKQLNVEHQIDKSFSNPLTVIDSDRAVAEAWKIWQTWQNAKLADRSPDYAPFIIQPEQLSQRTSPKTYQGMSKLLDGKRSLRDLAVVLNQDFVQFTSLLNPYIQLGLIELSEIGDHPPPIKVSASKKFLIACVDDSALICQTMEKVIASGGYDFLGITDDLRALPLLLNHNPDIIFLDLIMPHINGYEICSKLRKVVSFANVPIILMSAHDNLFERLKVKMSGGSEFLSKPINAASVLNIVSKYQQQGASTVIEQ